MSCVLSLATTSAPAAVPTAAVAAPPPCTVSEDNGLAMEATD